MSGLEPLIASTLAAAGTTTATAAPVAAATTAATTTAAATTAAATAATAGLTTAEIISGVGALSSAAGAGAALLAKPPKFDMPKAPTRDDARAEADQRSIALKRRGRGATLLTGAQGVTSSPTLGSPSLMGTA